MSADHLKSCVCLNSPAGDLVDQIHSNIDRLALADCVFSGHYAVTMGLPGIFNAADYPAVIDWLDAGGRLILVPYPSRSFPGLGPQITDFNNFLNAIGSTIVVVADNLDAPTFAGQLFDGTIQPLGFLADVTAAPHSGALRITGGTAAVLSTEASGSGAGQPVAAAERLGTGEGAIVVLGTPSFFPTFVDQTYVAAHPGETYCAWLSAFRNLDAAALL